MASPTGQVGAIHEAKGTIWKNLNYIQVLEKRGVPWKDLNYVTAPIRIIDSITPTPSETSTIWKELNYVKADGKSNELEAQKAQETVESAEAAAEETTEEIPWYLQETYVETKSDLIPERAPLPPLPVDSPDILEPILKQLDVELGLANLRILDLRSLDPAPALGPDIIMVFATARSDKHLHSSGDKICRWLRSMHKIHPFADGIIGRNEMKVINRRRRRRGKVAASQVGEENEQMQTEWVCVNVGVGGIILQLFTAARREELQLEALWERKIDTSNKRMEKAANAVAQGKKLTMEDLYGNEDEEFDELDGFERRREPEVEPPKTLNPNRLPSTYSDFVHLLPQSLQDDIGKGLYTHISRSFASYFPGQQAPPKNVEQAILLFAHVQHLQTLDPTTASAAIGDSAFDTTTTPYLRSFFGEMPTIPQHLHYHAWLALLIQGNILAHGKYPTSSFLSLATQMKASGIDVPYTFYINSLQAISTSPEFEQHNTPSDTTFLRTREVSRKMKSMMKILEDMSRNSGYDITTPEIYTILAKGLVHNDVPIYHTLALNICNVPQAAEALTSLLSPAGIKDKRPQHKLDRRFFLLEELVDERLGVTPTLPTHFQTQMVALAMAGYWVAFWNRWNDMMYLGFARRAEAYKLALGLLALAGDQNEATIGLRKLREDMRKEVPKVPWSQPLARGLLAVMKVAGGEEGLEGVGSELHELRKKCWTLVGEGKRL
ncbi:hypothetical protein DFH27DRAFT_487401 [Peziza echinospora]|nr:hypothetical protein DFH27DRAFT_487401 [Peziza echinospora]